MSLVEPFDYGRLNITHITTPTQTQIRLRESTRTSTPSTVHHGYSYSEDPLYAYLTPHLPYYVEATTSHFH